MTLFFILIFLGANRPQIKLASSSLYGIYMPRSDKYLDLSSRLTTALQNSETLSSAYLSIRSMAISSCLD